MSTFTDQDNVLKYEDQLCFALYSTSRAFTKLYSSLLQDMGITYPQYITLMVLWERDGLLVQEIAAAMEIDSATVSPMVQRLEKLELVRRERGVDDERRVCVFLTEKGRGYYQKALAIPPALGCATGVGHEQAEKLVRELKEIRMFMAVKADANIE